MSIEAFLVIFNSNAVSVGTSDCRLSCLPALVECFVVHTTLFNSAFHNPLAPTISLYRSLSIEFFDHFNTVTG